MLSWLARIWLAISTLLLPVSPIPTPIPTVRYEVVRIVDGDTIEVKTATGSARVRFLGMDTPELGQCMAAQAKQKLTELVGNNQVVFSADPSQPDVDKYGRLLRYVSVNKQDLSTQMLATGLAHYFTVKNKYALDEQLKTAEKSARDAKIGLWSPTACKPSGFCENLPVVMYHHIQPMEEAKKLGQAALTVDSSFFDQHLQYLVTNHYNLITVNQLVSAIKNHQVLPAKSLVITIDDAYDDAYNYAYPLLKKYGAVASLFVPTGLVGNSGYLNWDQIAEMNNSGVMPSFDHTWSHYSLPAGNDTKIISEITTAQTQLEEHLGPVTKIFAYPYGSYTPKVIAILKDLGFTAAFTTTPGGWQCEGNIMALPRLHVGNSPLASYGL